MLGLVAMVVSRSMIDLGTQRRHNACGKSQLNCSFAGLAARKVESRRGEFETRRLYARCQWKLRLHVLLSHIMTPGIRRQPPELGHKFELWVYICVLVGSVLSAQAGQSGATRYG